MRKAKDGHSAAVPMWAVLLIMTNGEVDRAMQLQNSLTEEWYYRWTAYNKAMAE